MGIEYDGELYDYVYPHIKNELIFDIGANIGEVVKRFVDKGGKVIAVEPQEELTTNENYKGVIDIVTNVCISDSIGKITFYRGDSKHTTISTCFEDWKPLHPSTKWTPVTMGTITLDTLIEKYGIPTYIKIDVEGFEDRVLGGLSHTIKFISFEFTQGFTKNFENCIRLIERFGFQKMTTFVKKKIKANINGRRKTIRAYKLVDEFTNTQDVLNFFNNKLGKREQGDILIEA